ncbi:MAG: orotidine-5'-phosphate decarboxylase [Candidatus Omnitrophica bacterium]|nr:orotidine-5'-phosphate decarboxylase [Candidatus Omnitrophota bacterium]MBU1853171.1 orotidine-5'-phosphate decarboxylase [Candidatus Omnitrophota bacterium]
MTNKIIVALDVNTIKELERLLDILSPHIKIFKVGMELFYSCGPKAVEIIKKYDREVFLDLKFFDIPNTVYSSSKAIARFGLFMFNVHVQGGAGMMKMALKGAEEESEKLGVSRPRILGVTVLTSMDEQDLQQVGINKSSKEHVLNLARLAKQSGLDGVVASPREVRWIRKEIGKDFLIVTPGIRPAGDAKGDQKRIATPREAINAGADYIVMGRPITKAKDPVKALDSIVNSE